MTSNVILFEERCECESKLPGEIDVLTSKVALIGDSSVGKTCLVGRWVKGHSVLQDIDETGDHVEDLYHKTVDYNVLMKYHSFQEYSKLLTTTVVPQMKRDKNGKPIPRPKMNYNVNTKLDAQVIDVTDFDVTDYSDIRQLQVNQADGFILCYDTTNPMSLADITLYQRIITRIKGDNVPIIVCGTKIDCLQERKVSEEEAMNLCEEMGIDYATCHFETSAMENINVNETFFAILCLIENRRIANSTYTGCNGINCPMKKERELHLNGDSSPKQDHSDHNESHTKSTGSSSSNSSQHNSHVKASPLNIVQSIKEEHLSSPDSSVSMLEGRASTSKPVVLTKEDVVSTYQTAKLPTGKSFTGPSVRTFEDPLTNISDETKKNKKSHSQSACCIIS